MGDDGTGAPLSRRVPGEARPGPGQAATPALPESVLRRMQAAIDAERAQELRVQDDPNTEPLPRVTGSGPPSKRGAKRAPSPTGLGPDIEAFPGPAVQPEGGAKSPRTAGSPRAEERLRVVKALRAAEDLHAATAARVPAATPELPTAAEPELQRAAEPEPVLAAEAPPSAEPPYPAQPMHAAEPAPVMPPATAAYGSQPTAGTIGWLWPEETAMRGGGGGGTRWRPPRMRGGGGEGGYRAAALVVLGAVVLAGGLFLGLSLHSTPVAGGAHGKSSAKATSPPTTAAVSPSAPTPATDPAVLAQSGTEAAAWVSQQVAAGTVVACTSQTCAALTANGFPVAQEVQLGLNSQSLSNATLVVMTPALHTLFSTMNPSLGNDVAPEVLASFGQVSIQPVDPAGAGAYQTALSQDVQGRIKLGEQLLNSGLLSASATARSEIVAGDVDARLLLTLQSLVDQQPVDVLAFTDSGPGASPGIPFRQADLALTDPASGMSPSAYLQSMVRILKTHASFPAYDKVGPGMLPDGQRVAQIEYAAPSPLGLLAP